MNLKFNLFVINETKDVKVLYQSLFWNDKFYQSRKVKCKQREQLLSICETKLKHLRTLMLITNIIDNILILKGVLRINCFR